MPPAENNLFAPEMAKNSPIETRTSRMAYCSKSPLPNSANWTNRFQSISCPSIRGCATNRKWRGRQRIPAASRLCFHPFDPLRAKRGGREWIREVLRFSRNLVAPELHDAHGVRRLAVIRQDEFRHPKITVTYDSSDSKPLIARLTGTLALYVASTAGSLA